MLSRTTKILAAPAIALLAWSGWLDAQAPRDEFEGLVQKVMYVHVPCAWVAMFWALGVGLVASIGFLAKRDRAWDRVALASMEVGTVFCTLVLVTGAIWGRAIWGVWWQWDARLTSALVLWFMYLGYLVVRVLAVDRAQGARWSAVVAIVACLDVPIIHQSVFWWHTLHPQPKVLSPAGIDQGLGPGMHGPFWAGVLAFTVLFVWLLFLRLDLERAQDAAEVAPS